MQHARPTATYSEQMTKQAIPNLRLERRATLQWLVDVFGFELQEVHPPDGDELHHAQLRFGRTWLMASTRGALDMPTGQSSIYLVVESDELVTTLHDRGVAAGGSSARAPEAMDYGGSGATIRDPEGSLWSVGTYEPAE